MEYLKILRENPDLAEEFDSLFDFFLLDELSPRMMQKVDAPSHCPAWRLPEMDPEENITCWKMVPSGITAVKGRQAVWPRAWTLSFPCL